MINVDKEKIIIANQLVKEKAYWLEKLSGKLEYSSFPRDLYKKENTYKQKMLEFDIPKYASQKLISISGNSDYRLHMLLIAAMVILVGKYTGNSDIILGSVIYKEDNERQLANKILPIRCKLSMGISFKELLLLVRQIINECVDNRNYPFEKLILDINVPENKNAFPLFDVMVLLENIQDTTYIEAVKTNIKYIFKRKQEQVKLCLSYNDNLYSLNLIKKITANLINLLILVVDNINIKIAEIEMVTEEEKRQMLEEFNKTNLEYLRYKTIQQLLEEQAFKTPEKEAVIYEGTKLTYRQLNENSNCLARILRTKGAKQEDVIAIMAKPSLEIIIGVIGVIKSGAAYVPIDPDYPKDRIRYMLEDCGARFLLTQKNLKNIVDKYEIDIIELDEEENYSLKSSNIEIINEPNDLAYIIYTSGSTGKPKGTEIEHKSLLNLSLWFKDYYEIDESTISTKYASIGFDASIMEIFPFLIGGATLHIISEDIRMDIKKLNEYYKDNGVNISFLPTQLCEQFMEEENNSLKKLLTGGDKLNSYKKKSYKLINNYGPTENTVVATCYEVKHWKHNIPIGKPITNTRIYILDKNQKIQPIGVAGELYISGVGLARGYLNCPELTLEKFVQNPFIEGERMYRTGDMARWLPDGNIEFLGRIGNQVKIRGYRIELGEIENQLLEYTAIKEAVVIVKSDDREDKYLTAYFVADKRLIIGDLREYLKTNLPEYMIPSYFIHLDAMPLTANGKIDRKALPEPERLNNTGVEYESPRNEVEQKLEELWRDILKIEKIGINDDFFELGGHSIRATILAARIRKEMNVDVSIKEVFIFPTIKGMAKYILSSEKRIYNAIEPLDEKPYYIVSSIQKRIYILQEMDEKSTIYNMPEILLIEGKLDKTRVQVTFKKLVQRHEALRTSFEIIGDEIVQKVHQEIKFKIDYYKVQKEQTEETEEIIRNFIKYFDLSIAPLFRIGIIELSEETHVLMMDMHHIISDGTSREIFIKDFASLYDGEELKELKIQYKDFAEWQRSELKKDKMKKQEEYWLKVFEGELPVLNIPSDYPRPAVKSNEGSHYGFIIDELLYRHIKEFARKNELTIFMVLLASLSITLAKYSRQDDITIGSVMAGRDNADIEDVIGVFLNNIAFRCRPNGDKKVIEYLTEIKECVLEGYENQSYPIEETIEKLKLNRDLSRNALFDIMLIYQNYQKYEQKIATSDWDIKPYKSEHNVSDYDMTFYVDEAGDKLDVYLQFYTRIYNSKTIQRFAEHWINTIRQMMSESEKELRKIKIAAENEKNLILGQLVGNIGQYPKEKTLQQLFEEQEELTPKNIALVYKNQQVTYEELNRKSNQLAENLRKQGVNPDSIVGVMAEKSIDMMVGILAVLKAGGAYLPIDPLYPKERIKYMLEDSGAEILLVQGKLKETVDFKGQTLCLEDESLYDGNGNNLLSINDSSNLAYVIYTSGTTGQPKGIMTEHRNVIAYITEFNRKFGISAKDTTLQQASITFDGFVEETYTVLTKGGKVVIPDQEQVKEAEELKELIDRYQVTILSCSPLILNQLNSLEPMKSVHTYLSSSDVLKKEYYSNIIKYAKVYNMYGPTETTVCTTCYHCTGAEENVSIGKPIANYSVYILDEGKNILPIGVPGEIYISGEGVSRGYINKLELAKEKFIDNPFIEGKRMYRTGDLGRWLPDGNIEFMGRSDHQVKIRGYRIELGEIESRLLGNKDVKDAVIIVKSDDIGDKHLTAYFIADKQLTIGELREYLKNDLPEYMIPSYFVQLDKMPLTPNGKIDKKALPEPKKLINTGAAYEAPRNETEQKLVELWQDILKVERIGINDNFFELGGHSLKATILAARIQQELEVKVSIKEIFKLVTVKEFAEYIVSCQKSRYYEIKPAEKMEYYPVSSVQKRLYTLQNIELGGTAYNLPQVLVLEGNIDKEKIEKAFRELVFRHEILRTSFDFIEGEILQKINEDIDFSIEYYEEDKDERIEFIVRSFIRPFDLSEAPLIRVGLIKIANSKYILMTDMHHIVSDGTSIQILIDDFIRLYEGKELNELKLQYKDYAVWQNDILKKDEMQKQESYWLNEFAGEIPVLNMPADKARPLLKSSGGGNYSFAIDERISANLKNFALENKATIFMALLEAYSLTLSKYSNQEDIIIGTVTAGREHADIQSLIGVFLNSIAFRCIPNKGKTVADYLQEIKETVLKGYENQSYPFEEIINKLNLNRDLSRNALFDVMLIYQNFEKQNESAESMDFSIDNYESDYYSADYDMTMYVDEIGDRLEINVLYYSEIFEKASIERFAGHFTNVLDQLIKNPQKKLQDINMLQEEERELVLKEFNNTAMEYPREKSIKELIEETVEKVPEKTAVVFKEEKLTYQQLNEKSNQL
ncbi:non-ribosomal peptide synthetase, partial [Aminipila sp.]|uniref:non-ribosomal peptide synthetase n=1 Tax=Aminipila sp. TaxID=2060095 RepID=UPI0028A2CCD0